MTGWNESWTIPGFFKNKNVFITGGTGFIGLVLIEKLLRSCPDIGDIYLLARKKGNKTPEDRIRKLTDQELFDTVRKTNPGVFNKLKAIPGDISEVGLGLSEEDQNVLASKINIIYHVAASVRFNDHLQDALRHNLLSTVEVLKLALACKNLEVYVHTSTAYCNSDIQGRIEEKVYTPSLDWRDALQMLDDCNRETIEALTLKIIHPLRNTYTYTKRLAEQAVVDMCKDQIDAVILRPSIVTGTLKEPISGWTNNLNGPFSITLAGLTGITSIFYFSKKSNMDVVYADNIVKSLIISTKEKYTRSNKEVVSVYNGTSELMWSVAYFECCCELARDFIHLENTLWYYTARVTHCFPLFYLVTMFHVLIAAVIDGVYKLQGKSARLVKVMRAIYNAQMAVHFFVCNDFDFVNDNYVKLDSKLSELDKAAFQCRCYVPSGPLGHIGEALTTLANTKKYYFHERVPPPAWVEIRHQILRFLQGLVHFIQPLLLVWIIHKYIY